MEFKITRKVGMGGQKSAPKRSLGFRISLMGNKVGSNKVRKVGHGWKVGLENSSVLEDPGNRQSWLHHVGRWWAMVADGDPMGGRQRTVRPSAN